MQAGWLTDLTTWIAQQLKALWDAFVEFCGDLLIKAGETVCDFFATAVEAIPVPDFLTQYSLDGMLGQAGPVIAWLVGTFRIGECFAILAAGFAFRMLRKLLTLGQW